eukprot:TRINITY_DN3388_c0_g1_i1.p1 TRINITY_DN3388_c0_g1~~TRINITY_DN3388_c0_g1_i1.p1  ORF type:complete len:338 (+),score=77.20 TRINITY_DN3388_c0_g1_i1:698-1711(+)
MAEAAATTTTQAVLLVGAAAALGCLASATPAARRALSDALTQSKVGMMGVTVFAFGLLQVVAGVSLLRVLGGALLVGVGATIVWRTALIQPERSSLPTATSRRKRTAKRARVVTTMAYDRMLDACTPPDVEMVRELVLAGHASSDLARYAEESPLLPLHIACTYDFADAVQVLVKEGGANVDARDCDGFTPLMLAVYKETAALARALLVAGATVDARNNDGATALMLACECCSADAVQLLLERGADVNARDNRGWTAAHFLAGASCDAEESLRVRVLRLLLQQGNADLETETSDDHETLLQMAERTGLRALALALQEASARAGKTGTHKGKNRAQPN